MFVIYICYTLLLLLWSARVRSNDLLPLVRPFFQFMQSFSSLLQLRLELGNGSILLVHFKLQLLDLL